jgi:hypothetical protein
MFRLCQDGSAFISGFGLNTKFHAHTSLEHSVLKKLEGSGKARKSSSLFAANIARLHGAEGETCASTPPNTRQHYRMNHLKILALSSYQRGLVKSLPWTRNKVRRWKCKAVSLLLSLTILFSTMETPISPSHHVHVHASSATAATITTSTSAAPKRTKQKMTYEDKLVQQYIEKNLFRDDVYDQFESVYKEAIQDEVRGLKPIEGLEDFGDAVITKTKTKKPLAVARKRGVSKKKGKSTQPFYWNALLKSHRPFSDLLMKTFNMSSKRASTISIGTLIVTPIAVVLYVFQAVWSLFRTMTVKNEGERYGGRE